LEGKAQLVRIGVNWGTVRVKTLRLATANHSKTATVAVSVNGQHKPADFQENHGTVEIGLGEPLVVREREELQIIIS
jgi:hypothetical protein